MCWWLRPIAVLGAARPGVSVAQLGFTPDVQPSRGLSRGVPEGRGPPSAGLVERVSEDEDPGAPRSPCTRACCRGLTPELARSVSARWGHRAFTRLRKWKQPVHPDLVPHRSCLCSCVCSWSGGLTGEGPGRFPRGCGLHGVGSWAGQDVGKGEALRLPGAQVRIPRGDTDPACLPRTSGL